MATLIGVVGVLLAGCEDEYVCPSGSVSEKGRCRLVAPDGSGSDVFAWPPADPATDLGAPLPYRPDGGVAEDAGADSATDVVPGETIDDTVDEDTTTDDAASDDPNGDDTGGDGDAAAPANGA